MARQRLKQEDICRKLQQEIANCRGSSQGRCIFPNEIKKRVLELIDEKELSQATIIKQCGLYASQIAKWRRQYQDKSQPDNIRILDVKEESPAIIKLSFEWGTLELYPERRCR